MLMVQSLLILKIWTTLMTNMFYFALIKLLKETMYRHQNKETNTIDLQNTRNNPYTLPKIKRCVPSNMRTKSFTASLIKQMDQIYGHIHIM
jgi:hypothetical protein